MWLDHGTLDRVSQDKQSKYERGIIQEYKLMMIWKTDYKLVK